MQAGENQFDTGDLVFRMHINGHPPAIVTDCERTVFVRRDPYLARKPRNRFIN